ncbi:MULTISPECIES: hypothetical protein [Pseudanabaena]
MRVIDKTRILKAIGQLEEPYIQQLAQALKTILDLQ